MSTATAVPETAVPLPVLAGRLITGYASAQLVYAAAALGLGEHLAVAPMTAAALAEATGTRADRLERVLRGLVVIGVVSVEIPDRYALTPLGACAFGSGPMSMRDLVLCGEESYRAWAELLPCLSNGETPFARAHGKSRFEYLSEHPERARLFNNAMAGMARGIAAQVSARVNLDGIRTIVDVGGGNGALLGELLARNPQLEGVLFDTHSGLEGAGQGLAARGLSDRCRIVEGDFMESVPAGGDAYVLSHVVHNWEDESARRILENCGHAAAPGTLLVIVEPILSPDSVLSPAAYATAMLDLQMLVMTGGRERSSGEHEALLHDAGFDLVRVIRGEGSDAIIEGRRA